MKMMIEDLNTKASAYRAFQKGDFGNKLRTWSSIEDLYASDYRGLIGLRYAVPGSKFCKYHIPFDDVASVLEEWKKQGCDFKLIRPGESAPDERLSIQGEYMLTETGAYFRYNTDKVGMRIAMNTASHAFGLEAKLLLERYMCPNSLSDLKNLLEMYPDSVVEFSTYEVFLGTVPNRNTVFWEVRRF